VFDKFAGVQMIDVHIPTTDGRELLLERYTEPERELRLLLGELKLVLPEQPPPKITAIAPLPEPALWCRPSELDPCDIKGLGFADCPNPLSRASLMGPALSSLSRFSGLPVQQVSTIMGDLPPCDKLFQLFLRRDLAAELLASLRGQRWGCQHDADQRGSGEHLSNTRGSSDDGRLPNLRLHQFLRPGDGTSTSKGDTSVCPAQTLHPL
jgi:hypothetical protein